MKDHWRNKPRTGRRECSLSHNWQRPHRKTLTSKRQQGSLQGQPIHSHCSAACQPGARSSRGTTRKAKFDSACALLRNLGRVTCQETTTVTELKRCVKFGRLLTFNGGRLCANHHDACLCMILSTVTCTHR